MNAEHCALCADCPFDIETNGLMDAEHFEIHMTVEVPDAATFKQVCDQHDIKAVMIAYQASTGEAFQPMTAQRVKGTYGDMLKESDRMARVFELAGFKPVRFKVETGPHGGLKYPVVYWEGHLAFKVHPHAVAQLRVLAHEEGVHLSKNAFKIADPDGLETWMVTKRVTESTPARFILAMKHLKQYFSEWNFEARKVIVEACIIDTNQSNDDAWLYRGE